MIEILLVEDDEHLCIKMKEALTKWGFHVITVLDFTEIDTFFIKKKPQLIIMDIGLPHFDGFYWCRKIREISKVPILFLSSRDGDSDQIMGMSMGGDDYVVKPFVMEVLIAKINALIRRTYSYQTTDNDLYSDKGFILDKGRSKLINHDKEVELTRNELRILSLLLENKNKIISRNKMMQALWDDDQFINDNTLTVNINRLRTKIKSEGIKLTITTKKGQGYMIHD